MRIHRIDAANFMRWDRVTLDLPDTGVVVVTGKNGHGKSTIIEAVAEGLYGQSVRDASGWRDGEAGGVRIDVPDAWVRRNTSKKGVTKLAWETATDGAGNYPTKTKAQAKLAETIGTFEVWERACVFSSHEAGRFTTATDKSRKELLEELLELERFSDALKVASRDRLTERRKHSGLVHAVELEQATAHGVQGQLEQARQVQGELASEDNLAAMREQAEVLRADLAKLEQLRDRASATHQEQLKVVHELRAKHNALADKLTRFISHAAVLNRTCPTCEQVVDADHRHDVVLESKENLALLGQLYDTAQGRAALQLGVVQGADGELERVGSRYRELVAQGKATAGEVERRKTWDGRVAELEQTLSTHLEHSAELQSSANESHALLLELDAACAVLGLQGARAGILAHALGSIQVVANEWLQRLGLSGLRVELSSQSTSKVGAVSDKISFAVHGAGGGRGYKASSGGERRRIDIAMMLALADIAAGKGVSATSTLFVDELFDALDDDGVDATVEVLNEIAADRCVVVISHNRDLVDRLPEAIHLHANDGKISRVRG